MTPAAVEVHGRVRRPAAARKSASSALCTRAAEVDVVGVERDPRELAVRVGVLDGEPAAGQDAGPAARRGEPGRRGCQRLGPARRRQFTVGVADQRAW